MVCIRSIFILQENILAEKLSVKSQTEGFLRAQSIGGVKKAENVDFIGKNRKKKFFEKN